MKSSSESKPFQIRCAESEIPGQARRKERQSRSKLKQAFLIDSPDFDILSGEFVRHKSIRVLEY